MTANTPGPKRDRYQIEIALLSELNVAAERRKQTLDEYLQVTDGAGATLPDRGTLIEHSSEARTKTISAYQIALKRFTDFVLKGILPDDLK